MGKGHVIRNLASFASNFRNILQDITDISLLLFSNTETCEGSVKLRKQSFWKCSGFGGVFHNGKDVEEGKFQKRALEDQVHNMNLFS